MAIHNDSDKRRTIHAQLGLTLLGFLVLFLCVAAMGVVWIVNSRHTVSALVAASEQLRKEQANFLGEKIAVLIRPLWTQTRQLAAELDGGLGGRLIAPNYHTSISKIDEVLPWFYAATLRETHMRSVAADGSKRILNNFIGTVAAFAVDDTDQPASDSSSCTRGFLQSVFVDSPDPSSDGYLIAVQYPNASSPAGVSRVIRLLDAETQKVGPVIRSLPPNPCNVIMAPLWSGHQSPHFANFSWYGPYNPKIGWGNHLEGNVPIYDASRRQIGRLGSAISLGKSVGPLLEDLIAQGGALSQGGQGAVYTADGDVIGLSELRASSGSSVQAATLAEIVNDSATARAVWQIKESFGDACPSAQHLLTTADRLIDVTPFHAELYGMPPLGQRWCLMMSVPRENVFERIDQATMSSYAVAITAGIGFLVAIALLGRSVMLAYRAARRMNAERRAQYQKRVEKAVQEMQTFACPMSVMHFQDFLEMVVLQCHEVWLESGKLRVLDSIEAVREFQKDGNFITLISHQWLSFSSPDNKDRVQLQAMQRMIQKIVAAHPHNEVYVWLDYISVAQRHKGMMMLAIHTLPAYVSVVNQFVICAPDAWHSDRGMWCNLATYNARGWCRTEMMAKICSSGLKDTYICAGEGHELEPFTQEDLDRLSLKVFEGEFSDREDMEKLVEPILGLYSLILKQAGLEHMRNRIDEQKDAYFPQAYCPDLDKPEEVRFLFGPLVRLLEEQVASDVVIDL